MKKHLPIPAPNPPRQMRVIRNALLLTLGFLSLGNANADANSNYVKEYFISYPILQSTLASEVTVTRTVADQNGNPIPGVTVMVQGTTIGTATDLDGRYSLEIPDGSTLVFSFIGL